MTIIQFSTSKTHGLLSTSTQTIVSIASSIVSKQFQLYVLAPNISQYLTYSISVERISYVAIKLEVGLKVGGTLASKIGRRWTLTIGKMWEVSPHETPLFFTDFTMSYMSDFPPATVSTCS